MARYLETAAEANKLALNIFDKYGRNLPEEQQFDLADGLARLVNYGMRCCPRAAHSTIRLNAVKRAAQGLPVKVGMEELTDPKTGKTYNALTTKPLN